MALAAGLKARLLDGVGLQEAVELAGVAPRPGKIVVGEFADFGAADQRVPPAGQATVVRSRVSKFNRPGKDCMIITNATDPAVKPDANSVIEIPLTFCETENPLGSLLNVVRRGR